MGSEHGIPSFCCGEWSGPQFNHVAVPAWSTMDTRARNSGILQGLRESACCLEGLQVGNVVE
jgi:hypothetical protein